MDAELESDSSSDSEWLYFFTRNNMNNLKKNSSHFTDFEQVKKY